MIISASRLWFAILSEHLGNIHDGRCACDIKIPLLDILFVLMFGILAEETTTEDICHLTTLQRAQLEQQFSVQHIPSESTFVACFVFFARKKWAWQRCR
jgi:hypothetical protein